MSKKIINQNDIYDYELINSFESEFEFKENPINRIKKEIKIKKNISNTKYDKLIELKNMINAIENCDLKNNANKLILGGGNTNSPIMVIGEAPGLEEDKLGLPFLGDDGDLLEKMLHAIKIKKENIYTCYAVNFRPPEDRKPTSVEIKRYSFFLKIHISIIEPRIIILMGSSAMECVTGLKTKISDERGKWKEIIIKNKNYPLIITFNPSYLLRFPENKKFSWEDLKKIKKKIQDLNIRV